MCIKGCFKHLNIYRSMSFLFNQIVVLKIFASVHTDSFVQGSLFNNVRGFQPDLNTPSKYLTGSEYDSESVRKAIIHLVRTQHFPKR